MGCICSRESIVINDIKYNIVDVIDSGGYSTIYFVEKNGTNVKYAVKKIICHDLDEEKNALQEVEYHKSLKHPSILSCIDYCLSDAPLNEGSATWKVVYIVLPFYAKGTLDDALKLCEKTKSRMPIERVLQLFIEICEAIRVFHCFRPQPLAHRDIKPSNILISDDGRPVVMDFGSTSPAIQFVRNSIEAQKLQDYASYKCTITYRPPELFHVEADSTIDQRTDIWSLGCLLYAMCFFKSPFDYVHEKGDSVALAAVSGRITIPSDSPYPENLHELIKSLLKVEPEERPFIDELIKKAKFISSQTDNTTTTNL